MKNLLLKFIAIVLLVSLSNCKKEESSTTFKVKINNYSFNTSPMGTVTKYPSQNKRRIDVQGSDSKYRVNIALQTDGVDGCIPEKEYTEYDVLLMITYIEGGRSDIYHFPDYDTFSIDITSCKDQVISGTFSGVLIKQGDPASIPDTLKLTNGVFENVKYKSTM